MIGYYGDCDYTLEKLLTLKPFVPDESPGNKDYRSISSVSASPNPSNGSFDVHINLKKESNLSVIVYDLLGVTQYSNRFQQVKEVNETIELSNATEGIYLIRFITDTDARDVRILIQR